jgi:hypothetical protein
MMMDKIQVLEAIVHRNFDERIPRCGAVLRELHREGLVRANGFCRDPDEGHPLVLTAEGRRFSVRWGICAV